MAISPAQRKAVAKYNANNYDRIELRVKKGTKDVLKAHAEKCGETLNEFINRAILKALHHDSMRALRTPEDFIEFAQKVDSEARAAGVDVWTYLQDY